MKQVPVSDFLPTLRTMVNVPLDFVMAQAVVEAAAEFCSKSNVLLHTRELDRVYEYQTIRVVGGSSLNRRTLGGLKTGEILSVQSKGEPLEKDRDYHLLEKDAIYFLRDLTDVRIVCSVVPQDGAEYLPDALFDDWKKGVCAGAASLLLLQPDADWAEPGLAAYYETLFNEEVSKARRWRVEASPETTFQNPVRRNRSFF